MVIARWGLIILLFFMGVGGAYGEPRETEDSSRTAIYDPDQATFARFGQQYMAVWFDEHSDVPGLYGALVDNAREPIGDGFIIKEMAYADSVNPAIAFDGANFLVVWEDGKKGEKQNKILGRAIARDGLRAGPEFVISDSHSKKRQVALAFDGKNHLVTWSDDRNIRFDMTGERGLSIYGRLISPEGDFIGRELSIATEQFDQMFPSVSYNGFAFLVVWKRTPVRGCGSTIMGKIVLKNGDFSSNPFSISGSAPCGAFLGHPIVRPDEDQFLVVWGQEKGTKGGEPEDIYGQMVGAFGELVGPKFLMSEPLLHYFFPFGDDEPGPDPPVQSFHF